MTRSTHYSQIQEKVREKALACGRRPDDITLIAVSKTYPVEVVEAVYQEGGRQFGESRVQEALVKIPLMPEDCVWHLIGTLQSNKVVKAISFFRLIHSVDTPELAQKISQASQVKGVVTSVLLQVNTSGEKTKHGLSGEEWQQQLEEVNRLSNLRIEGLMTMAPDVEEEKVIRTCFRQLYQWREQWRCEMKEPAIFRHLSMGMSHDYEIAIEEGATLLRVGTAIFGKKEITE